MQMGVVQTMVGNKNIGTMEAIVEESHIPFLLLHYKFIFVGNKI